MAEGHRIIALRPLTREAFAPFGQVVETEGADHFDINDGTTTRFHDLAKVETAGRAARTLVSIFRGRPFSLPVAIAMLERHPLGSQAFMPLSPRPSLAVVARDDDGRPGEPRAFLVHPGDGLRGVNYGRNVWHHPLIALEATSDFLVIDRGGSGNNLEEFLFEEPYVIGSLDSA